VTVELTGYRRKSAAPASESLRWSSTSRMYWDKVSPFEAASALRAASSSGASLTDTIDLRELSCPSSAEATESPLLGADFAYSLASIPVYDKTLENLPRTSDRSATLILTVSDTKELGLMSASDPIMDISDLEVDAFLADSVVVSENKLYAQGAGWDSIFTATFPFRQPRIGIGVFLRIPWSATNQMHKFSIKIIDQDGNRISLGDAPPGTDLPGGKVHDLTGQFNVGRPPLLNPGDSQLVPIAVNLDGLEFEEPNSYSVVITVDEKDRRRLPIRVRTGVQMPGYPQLPRPGV
jgi:hypothetical protein